MTLSLKELLLEDDPVRILRDFDRLGRLGEIDESLVALRMEIPAGYHHKDNLTHSIQVLANAISREESEPDLILRTAALLHDIGKPATRKFHGKGLVTFDGHEVAGAKIAQKVLKNHGYTSEEIKEIYRLIAYHMRSHGFSQKKWTNSAVRRLITDTENETTLNQLIVLFYSDITTKHKNKETNIYNAVDSLVAEIKKVKEADARRAMRPKINAYDVMEIFKLTPGRELGEVMKFLNTDYGISLSKEEAIEQVTIKFFAS